MIDIKFRKLYQRVTSKNQGIVRNSIIIFGRDTNVTETVKLNTEDRFHKNYSIEVRAIQYKYLLIVDLWIVTFRFEWKGRKLKR